MTLREAVVDLGAVRHNATALAQRVAPARLMVVVKADAYGHGRVEIARAVVAAGIRDLGALDVETALALREAGIPRDVTVLAWHHGPGEHFGAAIDAGVALGVSQLSELERIRSASSASAASVHLKIDTGLHRNGATEQDWPPLVVRAIELQREGILRIDGVFTHIAEASEDEDTAAMRRFERAIALAESRGAAFAVRHLAASSAGFRRADVRFDMVRMGGHVWGIPSFDGITPEEMGLVPALTLTARVTHLEIGSDDRVRRAEVPLGFVDGVPPNARGRVEVAIRGRRYRLDGAIEHGAFTVTVDDVVELGDPVTLFGPGSHGEQTVRQWGDLTGTLGDEIVARIHPRVPRRYLP